MGTPNIKRAQDWLVDTDKSWGIDAKEEQYGTWRGWVRSHSHIDLVEPRVRSLEGQMVGYSPGTNGRDVVLSTIILPRFKDSTEFVRWLPRAKGKLVLISAPLPTCRSQDQWNAFGTPESAAKMAADVAAVRAEWLSQRVNPNNPGIAGGRDDFSFTCYGVPTSGLGALDWDYGSLTWHTERDTYDKVVFDDLKFNATFTAMMAYLASEDPAMIPHERIDLAAAQQPAFGGRGGTRSWPVCETAPRRTNPRLK